MALILNNFASKPQPDYIKKLITNWREPVVFHNITDIWKSWNLESWKNEFGDAVLPFRRGLKNKCGCSENHPQWERLTDTVDLKFTEFMNMNQHGSKYWYYFDYKRIPEWFQKSSTIRKQISWEEFGYPEYTADESTIWIGNKGAHTPCHIDTYDNNLVLQVHGEKLWILFPPKTDLKATRVPYEESSIYSSINFFHPDPEINLENGYVVLLKPGDVLFVPQGWWHYVENKSELAISINLWIPADDPGRHAHIQESIVQTLMAQIAKDLPSEEKLLLINPNNDVILDQSINSLLNQTKRLVENSEKCCENSTRNIKIKEGTYIKKVQKLSPEDLRNSLQKPIDKIVDVTDASSPCKNYELKDISFASEFLNAVCDPDVISLIARKLIQKDSK